MLPLVRFGAANDFVMRVSIPSLTVLAIGACLALFAAPPPPVEAAAAPARANLRIKKAALAGLLLIGAVTPLQEFARAAALDPWPIDLDATLIGAACGIFPPHYVARLAANRSSICSSRRRRSHRSGRIGSVCEPCIEARAPSVGEITVNERGGLEGQERDRGQGACGDLPSLARRGRGGGSCECTSKAASDILGGNLSAIDAMITLHHRVMGAHDNFILSKGHAAGALYVTLWSLGLLAEEDLETFHADGTLLAGHPVPGWSEHIPFATGSLGHGFPVSLGMALARI